LFFLGHEVVASSYELQEGQQNQQQQQQQQKLMKLVVKTLSYFFTTAIFQNHYNSQGFIDITALFYKP